MISNCHGSANSTDKRRCMLSCGQKLDTQITNRARFLLYLLIDINVRQVFCTCHFVVIFFHIVTFITIKTTLQFFYTHLSQLDFLQCMSLLIVINKMAIIAAVVIAIAIVVIAT